MDCLKVVDLGNDAEVNSLQTLGDLDLLHILQCSYVWDHDVVEFVLERNL